MIWYGVEPLAATDQVRALDLAKRSELPTVRRYLTRRVVSAEPVAGLAAVVSTLKSSADAACVDILTGTRDALARPQTRCEAGRLDRRLSGTRVASRPQGDRASALARA